MAKDYSEGAYQRVYEGIATEGTSLTADQCIALHGEIDRLRKVEELAERLVNEPLIKTLRRLLDRVHGTHGESERRSPDEVKP